MSLVHQPAGEPASSRKPSGRRWPLLLALAILAGLIAVVYTPVLGFEFVDFDTYEHVIHNPYIRELSAENIKHILTTRCITSYYPVRTLTYAIDYQIWGLYPGGFKLTNVLIHFTSAALLFWFLLRLLGDSYKMSRSIALAAFAAAVFAIHPVVVESVVWVPGREELLMTLGTLGTIHFHLAARRASDAGKPRAVVLSCHGAAIFCCAMACLSNAVAIVIPALVVAWDLLMLPRRKLAWTVMAAVPLFVLAAATVVTKKFDGTEDVTELIQMTWTGRLMVAFNAYWLYLKTLAWPDHLCVFYDWLSPQGIRDPDVLIGIGAVSLSLGILWGLRRNRLAAFGILWFGMALAPTILSHQHHRADHFFYLPLAGVAIAVASATAPLAQRVKGRALVGLAALGVAIVLALTIRSAVQVPIWRTSLGTWQHCLDLDPNNARAHDVLGDHFARMGRFEEAREHYETVLKLRPYAVETLQNYGLHLSSWKPELRDYDRAVELVTRADAVVGGTQKSIRRTLAEVHANYAYDLRATGQYRRAVQEYERSLEVGEDYALPAFNLALLLVTCPDESLRRPQDAVILAEWALTVEPEPSVNAFLILATVYGRAGRPHAAMIATQKALDLAEALGDHRLAADLRQQLQPYREATRNRQHQPP